MKAVLTLEFNSETYELDINAPDLELDFVLSLVDRAQRVLEEQVKIRTAQQVSMRVRANEALNRLVMK